MEPNSKTILTYRVRRDVGRLVSFRLTKEMKNTIDKMAEEAGMTRSEFLRLGIETWLRILENKKLDDKEAVLRWDLN